MNRKARDRKIAEEIVDELTKALGPASLEMLTEKNRDTFEEVFERVFNAHGIVTEHAGQNVVKCLKRVWAKAAIRQGKTA